jgi:hypothetical protein
MSIQVLCLCVNWVVFLLLIGKSLSYNPDAGPLLAVGLASIVACSVGCLSTFSMLSFDTQEFLILLKFNTYFFFDYLWLLVSLLRLKLVKISNLRFLFIVSFLTFRFLVFILR